MAPTIGDFFTAVPGVVHSTTIPAAVGEILVRNDSPYDLWVKFNSQPSAAPGALTFSQYDLEVTPGREQIIPPPLFTGRMFIGCYDPGGKAASGTISSRANVYVRYYPQGQSAGPGAAYSALTGLDSTSQQRVISIPTEPHISGWFAMTLNASDPVVLYSGFALGSGPFNGTQLVTVYLYGFNLYLQSGRYADCQIGVVSISGGGAVMSGLNIMGRFRITSDPTPFEPVSPLPLQFAPAAGAAAIGLGVKVGPQFPGIATPPQLIGTVMADADLSGQNPPPAIGNGAGTPPGAIY